MLKDLVPESREIKYRGASFEVRGLGLEDITALLRPYRFEMAALFGGKMKVEEVLVKFPVMSATLIAFAAGEPDQVEKCRKLPFSVQLEALLAIWDMTVLDNPDAFLGNLSALAQAFASLARAGKEQDADDLPTALMTGTDGKSV